MAKKASKLSKQNEIKEEQESIDEEVDEEVEKKSVFQWLKRYINSRNSLWTLLLVELKLDHHQQESKNEIESFQSFQELKNMIQIPIVLENFILLGLLICLNSFLTLFTLIPLKIIIVIFQSIINPSRLKIIHKDLVLYSIVILSLFILSKWDISRIYHDVRGQEDIKLYVMFGVLEVIERLCSSIGQDIFNILLNSNGVIFIIFYFITLGYLSFHSYILIYQTISLNVAANSYSNALLTLLLSNQFAELKSSIFKKFEREGLFQITMADLSERFQLSLMLFIIGVRNLLQLGNITMIFPNSWNNWNKYFGVVFGPSVIVIGSEILVDWLKHCFISKFNKLNYTIYERYIYVLSLDFLELYQKENDFEVLLLSKRIGIPLLASLVCLIRMINISKIFQSYSMIEYVVVSFGIFSCLLLIRLLLSLIIFKITNSILRKNNRAIETPIDSPSPNGLSSPFLPGSPNTESSSINPNTRSFLYNLNEKIPPTIEERRKKKEQTTNDDDLNDVMRYKMSSKRIW
ncbi:unnamed protein product [Candida verbasci]|uniref:DUF747-domain-containing protein n=1 Tax=Candida verbasci TaxID=1227364 RepID=A0A9W4XCG5_9ASCO|nr:unnamed protein product [Candida verbasci]